jgi:hypothetical protein
MQNLKRLSWAKTACAVGLFFATGHGKNDAINQPEKQGKINGIPALVQANVVDTNGNAGSCSVSGDSFEHRNGELNSNGFLVMFGKCTFQVRRTP